MGNLRETCICVFSLQVLQGLHVPYNTLMYTLHPYEPTVGPVASHYLFYLQIMALLMGKYTLFASANLYYSTARLCSYLSTIFAAHLRVYTHMIG